MSKQRKKQTKSKQEATLLNRYRNIARPSGRTHACGGQIMEIPAYCMRKSYECKKCGATGKEAGRFPKGTRY